MRIESHKINTSKIRFQAGLTPQICREARLANIEVLEKQFLESGIKCHFKNDKPVAVAMTHAINLCQEAFKLFSLPFHYLPPSITVFDKNELINPDDYNSFGFCAWDNLNVLKDNEQCDFGAIFINTFHHNGFIEFFDRQAENQFKNNMSSSAHFLSHFLHEIFHNIHLNLLIEKYGIDSLMNDIDLSTGLLKIDTLIRKIPNGLDKIKIAMSLGNYATKSYAELFSETMAKLLTDSLKPNSLEYNSNPMDKLKYYPKCVQNFIKETVE